MLSQVNTNHLTQCICLVSEKISATKEEFTNSKKSDFTMHASFCSRSYCI